MSGPGSSPLAWRDDLSAIDWDELSALYRVAPLGDKSAADLKLVFGNSMFRVFAFGDGRLVGAGRALADGRDCAYLCDIAVHPTHQGRGLGKEIVQRLVRLSAGHRKIILYSVPDREPFYASFGFRRMTTAMAIFADQAKAFAAGYLADIGPKS
ncbi:GNAT family acetyltransferase [Bradyrhizobium macuxiense]|uniref:GNAT family acetyltransferase n=1 Tax=Bradyrhizobium macuxiense TaxID=1755647 RepID=A0A109K173_9BRAD|nr:GNAT family N-acetyltransferase [Bradyrhizobium macuxiense]KWV58800.1 GNAT family acetyltransferase [Bradyrhizobium macuxiense]